MVNAQEWLDHNFPLERRETIPRLNIKEKNLEGVLKIENFANLKELDCCNNQITSLEVTNCPNLKKLDYKDMQSSSLTQLKLNELRKLAHLNYSGTYLRELEIKDCPKLKILHCSNNRYLARLSLEDCFNLESVDCSKNELTELVLGKAKKLTRINCKNNQLVKLDLRDYPNLEEIKCNGNQLTELFLGELKELVRLECQNNQLTSLEIDNCSDLGKIDCQNNRLTKLGLSNLKELIELQCSNNQLTELNLDSCSNLENINCSNNSLSSLDLINNKELEILNISNNKFQGKSLDFIAHLLRLDNLSVERNELIGSLKPLRYISRLKTLNISYTNIDSGLEHLPDSLETFHCRNEQEKDHKVKKIEEELKGKVIAEKDYITSHYPDSRQSYSSYGYSNSGNGVINRNYSNYPTYEPKHQHPSGGNFASILKDWKKDNPGLVKSAELTKQLDEKEKELKQTEDELAIEREHAKNMDNFYRQNPPREDIALQNVLGEISNEYLKINLENKHLKEEIKNLKNHLELTEKLVELRQNKDQETQIQIPPK